MTAVIMTMVEACLAELERLLLGHIELSDPMKDASDYVSQQIANQRDRLLLWAHDVEMWTSRGDETLGGTNKLRHHIESLLSDMFQELTVQSAPLPDESLEEVIDVLDNLIRMEAALTNPARRSADPAHTMTTIANSITTPTGSDHSRPGLPSSTCRVVATKCRWGSSRPDVDVVVVSNPSRHRSWTSNDDGSSSWLTTMLPEILEDNDVYPRIISFEYAISSTPKTSDPFEYTSVQGIVNYLVQQLNHFRAYDPERPIFFVSLGLGGIVSKQTIITLLQEGISLSPSAHETPVSGCLFFSVPLCPSEAKFFMRRWLRGIISSCKGAPASYETTYLDTVAKDMVRFNETFSRLNEIYKMPLMYCIEDIPFDQRGLQAMYVPKQYSSSRDAFATNVEFRSTHAGLAKFSEDERDTLLPMVHFCSRAIQQAMTSKDMQKPNPGYDISSAPPTLREIENPFSMLLGYNSALLINDSSDMDTFLWSSLVECVRDCVDVACNFVPDIDVQLYNRQNNSFTVTDSAKAVMILNRDRISGIYWSLRQQLWHYILGGYGNSASNKQEDSRPRPSNIVVFTAFPPMEDIHETHAALLRLIDESEKQYKGALQVRILIVLLGDNPDAKDFFKRWDDSIRSSQALAQFFAPTFYLPMAYQANAEICKYILLGAISHRFAGVDAAIQHPLAKGIGSTVAASTYSSEMNDSGFWSGAGDDAASLSSGEDKMEERNALDSTISYQPDWCLAFIRQIVSLGPAEQSGIPGNFASQLEARARQLVKSPSIIEDLNEARSPTFRFLLLVCLEQFRTATSEMRGREDRMMGSLIQFFLAQALKALPEKSPQNIAYLRLRQFVNLVISVLQDKEASVRATQIRTLLKDFATRLTEFMAADTSSHSLAKMTNPDSTDPRDLYRPDSQESSDILFPDIDIQMADRPGTPVTPEDWPNSSAQRGRTVSDTSLSTLVSVREAGYEQPTHSRNYQKHRATFVCSLCPKRFTRAYNLRSHLRTHTDERPFVCSMCGKAFARMHDLKRHEGLHSGEKKFVCRGMLSTGGSWGCGRRFARPDALGRHFRSEAGRDCIRPLLDEEAREGGARLMETDMQQAPLPVLAERATEAMQGSTPKLPAALLQQYPALAEIPPDALPNDRGYDGSWEYSETVQEEGDPMLEDTSDAGVEGQILGLGLYHTPG